MGRMWECWWDSWKPRLFQLKAGLPAGADGLGLQGQRQQGCAVRQGLRVQGRGRWQSGRRGGHRHTVRTRGRDGGSAGRSRWAGASCRCGEVFSEAGGPGSPRASWGHCGSVAWPQAGKQPGSPGITTTRPVESSLGADQGNELQGLSPALTGLA